MKPCAYETESKRYEDCGKAEFKHVKFAEAPVCKVRGMFMTGKIRHKSVEWICVGTLNGCYHSFVEST